MEGIIIIIAVIVLLAALPFLLSTGLFNPNFINLQYFFNKILEIIRQIEAFFSSAGFAYWIRIILSMAAVLLITIFLYSAVRYHEIKKQQFDKLRKIIVKGPDNSRKNEKWESVLSHGNSANPSDWRLAIIEADTILDEMLKTLGYMGENLGERLKAVDPANFNTIDDAWEAHKVRNKIAHEGSDFQLGRDDARKVLGMYEKVFKEFDYI